MLQTGITQFKLLGLLASENVLADQLKLFFESGHLISNNYYRTFTNNLSREISGRFGGEIRRFETDSILSDIFDNRCLPQYNCLDEFYNDLFHEDFFAIMLNDDKAEVFSSIVKNINPLIIIAHKISQSIFQKGGRPDYRKTELVAANISPLGFAHRHCVKYAENHIHMGGATDPSTSLIMLANETTKNIPEHFRDKYILCDPNSTFSIEQLLTILRVFFHGLNGATMFGYPHVLRAKTFMELDGYLRKTVKHVYHDNVSFNNRAIAGVHPDWLWSLAADYYNKQNFHRSFFIYFVWLFEKYYNPESGEEIKRAIAIIIYIFGRLRLDMVMTNITGLERFVDIYDSKLRKEGNSDISNSEIVFMSGVTHLEYKAYESLNNKETFRTIYKNMSRSIAKRIIQHHPDIYPEHRELVEEGILPWETEHFGFHYCCNLIKKKDNYFDLHATYKNQSVKPVRHYKYRKDIFDYMKKLLRWLHSPASCESLWTIYGRTANNVNLHEYRKLLQTKVIDFRKLYRSIDAAGNEILTQPEVFAPYIRFLRSKSSECAIINSMTNDYHNMKKLTLSFHAGEDFSHIATGLRRIDETVRFMDYQHSDRIAHALALGIFPHAWANHPEVAMKTGERLDDLVWMWGLATDIGHSSANMLQNCARELGIQIYGDDWNIRDAYEAWELRRDCPIFAFKESYAYPDLVSKYDKCDSKNAKSIFKAYHNNTEVFNKHEELMVLKRDFVTKTISAKLITDTELDLIEEIQDYLITKYAQIGIIIEVNISSNLYIGVTTNTSSHPIFRWNPPSATALMHGTDFNRFGRRTGKINVCINTDDPGVFPTTVPNEFDMLRTAAKCNGHDGCITDKWLEELRLFGLEVFYKNHTNLFSR